MNARMITTIMVLLAGIGPAAVAGRNAGQPGRPATGNIVAVESFQPEDRGITAKAALDDGGSAVLRIELLSPYLVRTRVNRNGRFDITLPEKDGFLNTDWPGVDFKSVERENMCELKTEGLTVTITRRPFQLSFSAGSRPLCATVPGAGISLRGKRALLSMASPPDERFLGFGDQGEGWQSAYPPDRAPLDHRGCSLLMAGVTSERQYYIPFFMSSRGYGLFLNTLARSFWDMAKTRPDRYTIRLEESDLDFYLVAGPSYKEIIRRYTGLVGRPPLLPKWELGAKTGAKVMGIEKDGEIPEVGLNIRWFDQKEIEHKARAIRAEHVPCDYFHLDSAWQTIRNSFEWVAEIPDPQGMIELLNSLHFKVGLWQRPTVVRGDYQLYRQAEDRGYLVQGKEGKPFICAAKYGGPSAMVDFTNPAARKWWQEKVERLVAMGVKTFKLDSASSGFIESYPEAGEVVFHNGLTGNQMDNYYGPLYLKTVWKALKKALHGERAVLHVYHQTYFAGGRYPYMGLGDRTRQSPRQCLIRYAQNYGLSGVPFWQGGEFGSFGLPTVDLETRIRLIPYTYSYWWKAHKTGLPLVRAMILEFQDDSECYRADTQFLYGREFLVAPLCDRDSRWRRVYLPAGEWIDYRTGERFLGPKWRYFKKENGREPLLVRGGAIIPTGPYMEYVGQKPVTTLTIDVFPAGSSSFTLYEDDGSTYAYESGEYAVTEFTCREKDDGVEIQIGPTTGDYRGKPSGRNYIVRVHGTTRPEEIEIDSRVLAPRPDEKTWSEGRDGWFYKMRSGFARTLLLKLPEVKCDSRVEINIHGATPVRYYRD